MKSEFGRGYATCLRQFSFHGNRLDEQVESYARMARTYPDSFGQDSAAEMWANGSSDHLAELKKPRRGVPLTEWKRARALADRALHIGHGFGPTSKSTPTECRALLVEANLLLNELALRGHAVATIDECLATDLTLGLRPLKGEWSCSADLRRDKVWEVPQ